MKLLFAWCCSCFFLFSFHQNHADQIKKHHFLILDAPMLNEGMFSHFSTVVGALHHYELGLLKGLEVKFNKGLYYDPVVGPNWWEYYFQPIRLGDQNIPPSKKSHLSPNLAKHLTREVVHEMKRKQGYQLIKKYVKLKPHIQNHVDAFVQDHFSDHYIIGVHYRGTDRINMGGALRYGLVFQAIRKEIRNIPGPYKKKYKIFVATDEQPFLDKIQTRFSCPIVHTNCVRSTNGQPVHRYYSGTNYQKGQEALIDCLLLSRCHLLIRMDSILAHMAGLFNPKMPIVFLK